MKRRTTKEVQPEGYYVEDIPRPSGRAFISTPAGYSVELESYDDSIDSLVQRAIETIKELTKTNGSKGGPPGVG